MIPEFTHLCCIFLLYLSLVNTFLELAMSVIDVFLGCTMFNFNSKFSVGMENYLAVACVLISSPNSLIPSQK